MSAMRAYGGSARSIVDGLVALGTIFIPGLAEVKDLPQAANMALKLIAKGGFEKPWLPRKNDRCLTTAER